MMQTVVAIDFNRVDVDPKSKNTITYEINKIVEKTFVKLSPVNFNLVFTLIYCDYPLDEFGYNAQDEYNSYYEDEEHTLCHDTYLYSLDYSSKSGKPGLISGLLNFSCIEEDINNLQFLLVDLLSSALSDVVTKAIEDKFNTEVYNTPNYFNPSDITNYDQPFDKADLIHDITKQFFKITQIRMLDIDIDKYIMSTDLELGSVLADPVSDNYKRALDLTDIIMTYSYFDINLFEKWPEQVILPMCVASLSSLCRDYINMIKDNFNLNQAIIDDFYSVTADIARFLESTSNE